MKAHNLYRFMLHISFLLVLMGSGFVGFGCAASSNSANDGQALKASVQEFHKNLRWARYEFAAQQVDPKFREAFLGRYEELGEDYYLVHLEIKRLDMSEDEQKMAIADIEVEERWYREPNMVVKTDRVVERWHRGRQGWLLINREKKESKRAKSAKKSLEKAAKKTADGGSEESADGGSEESADAAE